MNTPILLTRCIVAILKTKDKPKFNKGTTMAQECENRKFEESGLYQEYLAKRAEILRHKWFESEKAGYDIGFEKALMDWLVKYGAAWRASRPAIHDHQALAA